MPGDPVAPRLVELAEKMDGDAIRHEEEACLLLAEQTDAGVFSTCSAELKDADHICGGPR